MRNLAELKLTNSGGRPVDRAPPTAEVISAFEREFNVSLPPEYLEFLKYSNGGRPELDVLREADSDDFSDWAVEHFFHLSGDQTDPYGLWSTMRNCRWMLGEKDIPFAMDGLGNYFVLDTSTTPAEVLVCDMDDNREFIELAPSFEEFIDRLDFEPDDEE